MLLSVGCKAPWSSDWKMSDMFSMEKGMPWDEDGPEKGTPVRVSGNWTDAVLNQAGQTPQRGFGGRLMFYGKKSETPIQVEGQLVVYAFDEMNREPTDNKPTRRYVFPPDQLALRMSETEMGPSYSFWLPWDAAGGPQTEVSLIARFEPKDGPVIVSEQTRHMLPGPIVPNTNVAKNTPPKLPEGVPSRPAVQQLSHTAAAHRKGGATNQPTHAIYETPATGTTTNGVGCVPGSNATTQPRERRMTTTSISLPENFRLRGGTRPQTTDASENAQRHEFQPRPFVPPPTAVPATARPTYGSQQGVNAVPQTSGITSQFGSPTAPPLSAPFSATLAQSTAVQQPLPTQPQMPTQVPIPGAAQLAPNTSYQQPATAARWPQNQPPSAGYPPASPPVPFQPASR